MPARTDATIVSKVVRSAEISKFTIFRPFAVTAPSRLVQEMSGFSTRQGRDLTKSEDFGIHRKTLLNAVPRRMGQLPKRTSTREGTLGQSRWTTTKKLILKK